MPVKVSLGVCERARGVVDAHRAAGRTAWHSWVRHRVGDCPATRADSREGDGLTRNALRDQLPSVSGWRRADC